jgi:hypothetical protein
MALTYPEDESYLLIADAFEEAVKALCPAPTNLIESWTLPPSNAASSAENQDPRKANFFEIDDDARCRIEKLMRDAIADGELGLFVKAGSNRLERLVEREDFRQMSFGIPGFENVPHHLTSPGEDTSSQAVCLRKSDFHKWLSEQRGESLDPFHTGAPGKPTAKRLVQQEHERRLKAAEGHGKVSKEASALKAWLDRKYPEAPPMSEKTIENAIREPHRKHWLPQTSEAVPGNTA